MSEELYTLILNPASTSGNVISNANMNAVQFNVNWQDFLPQKYPKYSCKFVFQSLPVTGAGAFATSQIGFVNINFGKSNVFDGQGMINNIGAIYPTYSTNTYYTYNGNNNNNNDFVLSYPTNNQITVQFNTFANAIMTTMVGYNLVLTFKPLEQKALSIATPDTKLAWKQM